MSAPLQSRFVFALCQLGAEAALKREIERLEPTWRAAFQRPGVITWKTPELMAPGVELPAVLARAHGLSLGHAPSAVEAAAGLAHLAAGAWLHVSERDRAAPGEEREPYGPLAAALRAELVAAGLDRPDGTPPAGATVLDVIVAPGEPLLLGAHLHHAGHTPWPGGRPSIALPAEAPSRAYLKAVEAMAWSALPLAKDQVAVEIGSAPGGASWALLERGLTVVGVDPGDMAPPVLGHPGFSHLRTTLTDLRREALPPRVDWLLMDVNLAPQVALHGVRRLVQVCRSTLRGVIFTLKLNDWSVADEIPALLARVTMMGLTGVRARQLANNRREICVVARGS
jgi:23S rRNA (cytidine2498-2'-O)-methyltransferase